MVSLFREVKKSTDVHAGFNGLLYRLSPWSEQSFGSHSVLNEDK
jgi:hypothetical protein